MLLRHARKKASLTQAQLEQRLGAYKGYVSKYESGERELTVSEFIAIAEALDVEAISIIREIVRHED